MTQSTKPVFSTQYLAVFQKISSTVFSPYKEVAKALMVFSSFSLCCSDRITQYTAMAAMNRIAPYTHQLMFFSLKLCTPLSLSCASALKARVNPGKISMKDLFLKKQEIRRNINVQHETQKTGYLNEPHINDSALPVINEF